jgi:hypothetical protein
MYLETDEEDQPDSSSVSQLHRRSQGGAGFSLPLTGQEAYPTQNNSWG